MLYQEPSWWVYLEQQSHAFLLQSSPFVQDLVSLFADIFVFTYPVFLLWLYGRGIRSETQKSFAQTSKNNAWHAKTSALQIFFSVIVSICMTMFVQLFATKQRPFIELWLASDHVETPLHSFLPSTSFPSDHATVSFAFATAVLLVWIQHKNPVLKVCAVLFYKFAIIMAIARVMTAVHRPTDVIVWDIIWIIWAVFLTWKPIYNFFVRYLATPLIRFEKKIFWFLYK